MEPMREYTASMTNAPHSIDPNDDLVLAAVDIAAAVTGENLPPRDFPAWSDAGLLSNHTDAKCLMLGPGNIGQVHANDEFSPTDEIIKAAEIYYKLINQICG